MTARSQPRPTPRGVLVIDKPAGMTSHDVVDEVRKRLRTKKVGHGGTLDPDATGVLVVGVGSATRLLEYAQRSPKRYRATARFGITTTTQDASGEVIERRDVGFDRTSLEGALGDLVGEIEQVPPMVSAVKIGGERLYRKARRGEEVERPARPVTVHELKLVGFDPSGATAELEVACSAGTYVRTLVYDLGRSLGCGAHLTALRRTGSGGFTESDAVPLDEVDETKLRAVGEIVHDLRRLDLDPSQGPLVDNGRALESPGDLDEGPVALFLEDELVAIYRVSGDRLVAEKVLAR